MSLLGFSSAELLVMLVVIVLMATPRGVAKTVRYAKNLVTAARGLSASARSGLASSELGASLKQVDLSAYDPRELIRQAVKEEVQAWQEQLGSTSSERPATELAVSGPHIEGENNASTAHSDLGDRGAARLRVGETAANCEVNRPVSEDSEEGNEGHAGRGAR